jgi:hypothetical protein
MSCNTVRLCLGERNVGQFGLKNVVCVFDPPEHARAAYKGTPLTPGEIYLYLGEISNMPGHGAFATSKGQVLWGYHTENFWVVLEGVQIAAGSDQHGSETLDIDEQHYEPEPEEPGVEITEAEERGIRWAMELMDRAGIGGGSLGDADELAERMRKEGFK